MQEKKVVFIGATRYEEYCSEGRNALLDAGYTLIENVKDRPYTEEELREVGPEIDAVICGCELWNENTISAAPRLKVIVKFAAGGALPVQVSESTQPQSLPYVEPPSFE